MAESENHDKVPISFVSNKSMKVKKNKKSELHSSKGITIEVQSASVEDPLKELFVPEKKPESNEKAILFEQVIMPQQEKVKMPPLQQTKTLETETVSQSSINCQYGFGYLDQRKKGEEIPDACIECPKLLNCMLSDYYKKKESVTEIKKWYAT